jgi:hypothetical protein
MDGQIDGFICKTKYLLYSTVLNYKKTSSTKKINFYFVNQHVRKLYHMHIWLW